MNVLNIIFLVDPGFILCVSSTRISLKEISHGTLPIGAALRKAALLQELFWRLEMPFLSPQADHRDLKHPKYVEQVKPLVPVAKFLQGSQRH